MKFFNIILLVLVLAVPASSLTLKPSTGASFLADTQTGRLCAVQQPDGTPDYLALISPESKAGAPTNGVQATLTTDMTSANADITLTSVAYSYEANQISITYLDPGANDQALDIVPVGKDIVVRLATGSAGAITSVCNDVVAALNANERVASLVTATAEGAGTGEVEAIALANLASGVTATPGIVGVTLYVNTTTNAIYRKSDDHTWAVFLPASASLLATSISDSDLTHAPNGNAVFDALALKLPTTAITSSISDSDLTHAPDGNSVFDALALKFTTTGFAAPPAIGGTTPAAGAFTTLDASAATNGYFAGDMHSTQVANTIKGITSNCKLLHVFGHGTTAIDLTSWDSSGYDNRGTYTASLSNVALGSARAVVQSVDGGIDIPDAANLSFGDASTDSACSFGVWLNVTASAHTVYLFSKDNASPRGEWVSYLSGAPGKLFWIAIDSSTGAFLFISTDEDISVGTHFLAVTYDGSSATSGLKAYVDGLPVAVTGVKQSYTAMENTAYPVRLMKDYSAGSFCNSPVGCMFITAEELTAAKVLAIYTGTKAYYGK